MNEPDELPVFPVTGWEIADVPAMNMIIFRPAFLSHATQKPEQSDPGRRYALTPRLARDVIAGIQRALDRLDNAAPEGTGLAKH